MLKYTLKSYNSTLQHTKKTAKRKYSNVWKTSVHMQEIRASDEPNIENHLQYSASIRKKRNV